MGPRDDANRDRLIGLLALQNGLGPPGFPRPCRSGGPTIGRRDVVRASFILVSEGTRDPAGGPPRASGNRFDEGSRHPLG